MAALNGEYLGIQLSVSDIDIENLEFFRRCGAHEFSLQRCKGCGLLRYPPTTGCPWCAEAESEWTPVEGRGAVHSYGEVHHAIQPQFRGHLPYQVLLVDLDVQRGIPSEHEALRIVGNLVTPGGELAPPEVVKTCGIGTRVRMVYRDVGEGFALPQWTIDEGASQPTPWRYAQE
ncbi:MAG: OB-fold domain-containing protein [Chloroflexi bacterium]|nr:OB-fold domain-containing protein [Chloroflexota bacterium]